MKHKVIWAFVLNIIMAAIGCYLLADTWTQFWGYLLLTDSILMTIEKAGARA